MAFQLKSAAFPHNGRILGVYACDGEDVPPSLAWSGAPAGTKSFALIVDDPDAPGGTFCHWAIFDIGPTTVSLDDGIPTGAHETVNDFDRMDYGGPCPPPGPPHHYRFRLLALDIARLNVRPHAKCQDVQRAAESHMLAKQGSWGRMPARCTPTRRPVYLVTASFYGTLTASLPQRNSRPSLCASSLEPNSHSTKT